MNPYLSSIQSRLSSLNLGMIVLIPCLAYLDQYDSSRCLYQQKTATAFFYD